MKNNASTDGIRPVEKLLLWGDTPPWDAFYRTAIGYLTIPAMWRLLGANHSGWILIPFLLGVLFMIRLLPVVFRKVLPFSTAVQGIWSERRQTAKHYDSYQWQKLMWIGVGLGLYTVHSRQFLTPRTAVAIFCILSGAIGLVRWRSIAPRTEPAPVGAKQTIPSV